MILKILLNTPFPPILLILGLCILYISIYIESFFFFFYKKLKIKFYILYVYL